MFVKRHAKVLTSNGHWEPSPRCVSELRTLKELQSSPHPNLVCQHVVADEPNQVLIFTPFCHDGDLFTAGLVLWAAHCTLSVAYGLFVFAVTAAGTGLPIDVAQTWFGAVVHSLLHLHG
jgi:hypothetical protein